MSRIRGKNTGPEMLLRRALHRAGCRFRLHRPDLPGKPDIVLSKHKAVILVHGCFWHRHEGCAGATVPSTRRDFWLAKFEATVERDHGKQRQLEELGWRVITVWECELENDTAAIVKSVIFQLDRNNYS